MKTNNTIDLQKIKSTSEKDILMHLNQKANAFMEKIIKELQLSTSCGQEAIYSLLNKGLIKHRGRSSFIELNVKLKEMD